jgi:hypothetical protein
MDTWLPDAAPVVGAAGSTPVLSMLYTDGVISNLNSQLNDLKLLTKGNNKLVTFLIGAGSGNESVFRSIGATTYKPKDLDDFLSQIDMLTSLEENKTLSPTVSIPFSPQDKYLNISFNMTPDTGKAMPNLNTRVFEYSTAYTDRPTQYSSTANRSILAIAELIIIQMNVAKLLYYSLIIALIVVGILVFVGVIPILIKWIMSKLVS